MTFIKAKAFGRASAYLFSIVLLAILLPLPAQAQSEPAIAVAHFASRTVAHEDFAPEVSASIAESLADELSVDVVVATEDERTEAQISITGRIYMLESKPALMARITHIDSRRTFTAIVGMRNGETHVEMAQRLAERIGATITARTEVLTVAPRANTATGPKAGVSG
jgi:hypothetical protein